MALITAESLVLMPTEMLRRDLSLVVLYCTVFRYLLMRFMMGYGYEMLGVVCSQQCRKTNVLMALIGVTFSCASIYR